MSRSFWIALPFAVALAAATPRASALDWPRWLGPDLDGISRETGWLKEWPDRGPPELWRRRIGEGYSGVVVAKGHLVLFHRLGDELVADSLDPLSGKRQWRFSYPTDYIDLYGYSGGPRCAPEIRGDRVYTLGPKGVLHSLDLRTGKELWKVDIKGEHELGPNFFGTGATPLIAGGVIYCNLGGVQYIPAGTRDGLAFAFDAGTGKLIWKSVTDGGSYASPKLATIHGARHLFIFHRGGLSSFDPESGRERWKFPWHARFRDSVNGATPVVAGDLVFISATYRTGSACLRVLDGDSYEVVWKDVPERREKVLDIHWAPPIYLDGHLYAFSGRNEPDAVLKCVELRTGAVRWEWRSYLLRGSMIHSDGRFIALGEWGDLALLELDPESHKENARVQGILSPPSWTVPTLAGGLLYLRDLEKLICLDLRPRKDGESAKEELKDAR